MGLSIKLIDSPGCSFFAHPVLCTGKEEKHQSPTCDDAGFSGCGQMPGIEILATFQIAEELTRKLFSKAMPVDGQFVNWVGGGPQQPIGIYSSL